MSVPRTPTASVPFLTASCAYSTWNLQRSACLVSFYVRHLKWNIKRAAADGCQSTGGGSGVDRRQDTHKWPSGEKTVIARSYLEDMGTTQTTQATQSLQQGNGSSTQYGSIASLHACCLAQPLLHQLHQLPKEKAVCMTGFGAGPEPCMERPGPSSCQPEQQDGAAPVQGELPSPAHPAAQGRLACARWCF